MTNIAVEMEEPFTNDRASFQRFLAAFCKRIEDNEDDSEMLPFRPPTRHLTIEELQGECFDWSLRYLGLENCPPTLAAAITKEVYEQATKLDFKEFEDQTPDPEEEANKEKNANNEIQRPESVLDASSLMEHIIDMVDEVCQKWNKDLPDIPIPAQVHECYHYEIKNTRRKMEDRYVMLPDMNTLFDLKDFPHQSYYSVFDGHAGIEAAVYASNHLHVHLPSCEKFSSDPASALKCSYSATDEHFIKKAQREGLKSGCTGLTVLIRDKTMYLAWLGDSQACLVRDGQALSIMNPHKPERQDEKSRIEALGGVVLYMGTWRVNGNLAVSRAIGDISQKKFICSDADTTVLELEGTEDYIILACDGMWDGISQNDVPKIVYDHLQKTNGDKASVAKMLVELAKQNGSTDNITVVIVFLRDEIAEPAVMPVFSFDKISSSQGDKKMDDVDGKKDSDSSSEKGDDSKNSSDDGNTEYDGNKPKEEVESTEQQETQEQNNSDKPENTPLPTDRVLKKEPVFIIADSAPQISEDKPRTPSPKPVEPIPDESKPEEVSSASKDLPLSETVPPSQESASAPKISGNSLPVEIGLSTFMSYLPNQGSTISEFRHGLQGSRKPSAMSNSLAPMHEDFPIVSNYVIQDEIYRKKDTGKKKPKRNKNPKLREQNRDGQYVVPRRGRKKADGTTPVVWAFTGKNTAAVRNHKLSSLRNSQNSSRVILANILNSGAVDPSIPSQTSADVKFLEKLSKSKHFIDPEQPNAEEIPMPHTVFDYPLSTFTASSNFKTKTTSTPKSKSSQASQPKNNPKTVPAFHQSWRPRKLSKLNTGGSLAEPPPTPFSNVKIYPSSECSD
ncbi:protein phosphatase 1E-like [Saccostrea cucullata]|uniref:protein phosphatase 1E-like n=1 Tax=Saccostrea cuccullata TaxID=36930 RepID=UPI002ED20502